jgi:hypothetical protein
MAGGPALPPALDLLDPGLERGHLAFQAGHALLDDLAPAGLVGQQCLDAPERPGDRLVLLLEPFQASVDFVEMAEDLAPELAQFALEGVEALAPELEKRPIFGAVHRGHEPAAVGRSPRAPRRARPQVCPAADARRQPDRRPGGGR